MAREIETKCIHLEEEENSINHYGAISYPIYQSATYAHPGVGQSTGYDYSRLQNIECDRPIHSFTKMPPLSIILLHRLILIQFHLQQAVKSH